MITEDHISFETAKLLKEKGFEVKPYHQYYVSKCGKVFGCKGDEMKQETTNRGYKRISLSINGKHERWSVHRLVALLFVPNPEQKLQVNHIDGNKENNHSYNLEWCTASENVQHSFKTGLKVVPKGKYLGKDNKLSKPFICVETGKVYNCLRELAEDLGESFTSTSHISRACKYGLLDHGFHWRYYEPNELVKLLFAKGYTKYPLSYDGDYWFCYVQMVMKWLREIHKINIEVCLGFDTDSELGYFYNPVISDLKNMALAIETPEFDETEFTVYEEAAEAAIKYCLENLI